jgi:aryl-alcohol dehydrogenase-like predicted oxidoreductase
MSTFAFGTYRISDENPLHIEAIKEAIRSGIELFDTATNYSDGGAERALAKAMRSFSQEQINKLKIVSKFGYIQGSNLKKHQDSPFEDAIEFSQECYYSIAPSFCHQQLSESLERLKLNQIDCYLIHNPEYYLYDAIDKGVKKEQMLDDMYKRIYKAFLALEEEVANGRIKSYGISSNAFAKSPNDPEFLPYEDIVTLAQKAAQESGAKKHSFTTVELPINILEQEGLKCAKWAKSKGLRVLSNRPLNAEKNKLMYRLAEYEEPKEYYHAYNELLEVCETPQLQKLYNLVEQMDMNRHKFGWIGDYEGFLYAQILPHIKTTIEPIDESVREVLLRYIDTFLVEYKKMVAYECSKITKTALKEDFNTCSAALQECAVTYLLTQESIDYIIVGMRRPTYVDDMVALKDKLT